MRKPMIFSEDKPFRQLSTKGKVATFRKKKKEIGEYWICRSRTGSKEFDAKVRVVHSVESPEQLADLADMSGFENVKEWCDKIRDMHGEFPEGYVHVVEKEEEVDE